jgi:hypothetical protein
MNSGDTTPLRVITVFSGSADSLDEGYIQGAWQCGACLALRGITLVYGAGKTGLMGAVADGALACKGEVIGVINDGLNTPELAHSGLTRVEVFPDLAQRKARMLSLAEGFICLPGGFGTFDELFEALTLAQLGVHHKPIGLLNLQHYFDPLLGLIDHSIHEHFIYPEHRELFVCANDADKLIDLMQTYQPPQNLSRWVERPS